MPRRTGPRAGLPPGAAPGGAPGLPADRWAAATGHDLRQSLQAATVQAHALMLQARQQAQPGWAQLGAQMAESLQHCQRLLENLLASLAPTPHSLPLAGAPPPDWRAVDLGALLDALLRAWQPTADQRGLRLTLQRPDPAPSVLSDALLLRRVLDNLVGNALAYTDTDTDTDTGGVALQLQWLSAADSGPGGLLLTVSDCGAGLPADRPGLPRKAAGHGLGLMIARGLCAQLGISFDLQGQAGAGTVAQLAWPAVAAPGLAPPNGA